MLTGVASAIAMCRDYREQSLNERNSIPEEMDCLVKQVDGSMHSQSIFYRRARRRMSMVQAAIDRDRNSQLTDTTSQTMDLSPSLTIPSLIIPKQITWTHRNQPLLSGHGEYRVVAARAASSRIDEEVDEVIDDVRRGGLGEHNVEVLCPEDLLEGIEGQTRELRLDKIRPVLHDCLEFDVPIPALPARNQVEHVNTVRCFSLLSAFGASKRYAQRGKHG